MTTPSMCMEVTLVARCRNRLATEPVRSLRLLTTSWRVLDGLSWRLLVRAQAFMWANSSPCGLPTQCGTGQFWPAWYFQLRRPVHDREDSWSVNLDPTLM